MALETAAQSDLLQAVTRDIFQGWCETIISHLVTEGWPAAEARQMAIFMMSALNGALVMSRAARRTEPLDIVADQVEQLLSQKGA